MRAFLILTAQLMTLASSESVKLGVRVDQSVPRHRCRRALRNLEEVIVAASKQLYELSEAVEQVSEATVELPPSWRGTECVHGLAVEEGGVGVSDILVTSPHPILGNLPHAPQPEGCRQRGLQLSFPFPLLTTSANMEPVGLEQALVAVSRWYFGVFPEVGEEGDAMYPATSQEGPNTRENRGCSENALAQGRGLCPLTELYDSGALTKQNMLCSGLSARQTILSMVSGGEPNKWKAPSVRFVMPLDTKRTVLLLDTSLAMGELWESVLSATFHYISSLREGTELAIVSFQGRGTVHLQPTRVEGGNREGLHYRIPRRLSQKTSSDVPCLECGMQLAQSLATNTSTVVLLSSSLHFPDKNSSKLMEFERSANPILHRLVVAAPTEPLEGDEKDLFLIDSRQSRLNISSQLALGLASLPGTFSTKMFHQEELPMRSLEGSFSVEPSLASDLWLQLLTEDTTDINVFEVRSPSGQVFSFPKFDAGLVYFSLRGPRETGVWSYKVRFYSAPKPNASFLLECWASGSPGHLRLSAWVSAPTSSGTPAILYARLENGGLGVSDALLEVQIQRPASPAITLRMEDTGSGFPDITRGDGIYSAYFTQFSPKAGIYSVTVTARNNSTATVINTKKLPAMPSSCCGSSLPTVPAVPLEPFTRSTMSASFSTSWPSESRDVFPPGRITDFRLASTSNSSLFVSLEWTAPGDDYNSGQAFSYEVRCFTSKAALSEENYGEQGIPVHSSLVPVPEPHGQPQRCTVSVPWPNEVFFYAIVAFDAAGNRGEVSNMVAVYVTEPLTTVAPQDSGYPSMEDVSRRLPLKSFLHSESMVYVIAGIISAILILLVLVLVVIVRHLGGCASKRLVAGSTPAPPSPPPSLPDLCQGPQEPEPYSRHSVSYVSGFHLPEMLDYSMIRKASTHQHFPHQYNDAECRPRPLSPSVSPVNSTYTTTGHSTDCSVSVSGSDHELVTGDAAGLQVVAVTLPRRISSELQSSAQQHVTELQTAARHVNEFQNAARHVNELQAAVRLVKEPPSLARHPSRPEPKPRKTLQYNNNNIEPGEQKPRKTPPAVPNKTVHASLV